MSKAPNSGCGWLVLLLCSPTLLLAVGDCPAITRGPSNIVAYSCDYVVFQVEATGTPPLRFQWYRENTPIPGATNDIYIAPRPAIARQGRYFVTVQNEGCGAITSLVANLFVLGDLIRPGVLRATVLDTMHVLLAFYRCPLDPGIALDPANYEISGGIFTSNALIVQETNVLLTTSAMASGAHYVLHLENIRDIESNVIEPTDVSLWIQPLRLFLSRSNNIADLTWAAGGILQRSLSVTGQWLDATGPTNRARLTNGAEGFYRVRFP